MVTLEYFVGLSETLIDIVLAFAIRQCVTRTSTLITFKTNIARERKTNAMSRLVTKKEISVRKQSSCCFSRFVIFIWIRQI